MNRSRGFASLDLLRAQNTLSCVPHRTSHGANMVIFERASYRSNNVVLTRDEPFFHDESGNDSVCPGAFSSTIWGKERITHPAQDC